MEGSNLSKFSKFCEGSYLYEFQKEGGSNLRIYKIEGILTFFWILGCKNTASAGYDTLGWVFQAEIRSIFCSPYMKKCIFTSQKDKMHPKNMMYINCSPLFNLLNCLKT